MAVMLGIAPALLYAANATYLNVTGPINATLYNNESIYLGMVGPGESFYVLASPNTTSMSGNFVNIGWNKLEAVSIPAGWSSQSSALYENPMKMKITVSPSAANGRYRLTLRSVNVENYSGLGNLTFYAYANVTPDVFRLGVTPKALSAGVGQKASFYIEINNTGVSDDPFIISAESLPAWNISMEAISVHSTKSTFEYPVYLEEPGVYAFNLTVRSAASPLIEKSYPVAFTVEESLPYDYSTIGRGVILFPIIFEPAYAFMSFISTAYRYFSGRK